jgi:DNA-binding MurR/RpiR family transcriptional regulator
MGKAKQKPGSGPHGTIAEAIRHRYDGLTPTERKPAQTLLANYPFAGMETVAKFAERAGVSGPTILRLIAKLGYSGYADFQQDLRDELQAQLQSPLTKRPESGGGAAIKGRGSDFLREFGHAAIDNIRQTLDVVLRSEFDRVIELLCDTRRPVLLLGGRFTGPVANYLYQHLHTLRPGVQLVSGQEAGWRNHLLDTGRRHVLLVFDIRRYQNDVVNFAEEAAQRGATVVLFTDQWLSPISGVARHMLTSRVTVPSNWDSMVAMFVTVEAIIAQVSAKLWPTARSRVEELDRLLDASHSPD